MRTWSIDIPTSAPCLLFTLTRVDREVEYFTTANQSITIDGTTWTAHPGLQAGVKTARIDGTPPTFGFRAQLQSEPPLKFRDFVRGKYEGAYVYIEMTSQDDPATRDLIFAGKVLGDTSYNQHGVAQLDLISDFAVPRARLIEKFSLMCRFSFGQWNTCRVPVWPHDCFPNPDTHEGSDPPLRSTQIASGSWRRYRFGSAGTPEDYANVILVATATPNPGMTAASAPAFSSTIGATTTDGQIVWTTTDAYARAAKVVAVDKHTITLDRLPDPRWTTTLVPEQVKFVFRSGEYKNRAFKGAAWNSSTLSFQTYLPCPLAALDDWIEIAPECNKTHKMCKNYFNNTQNHGGYPFQLGAKAQAQQLGYEP